MKRRLLLLFFLIISTFFAGLIQSASAHALDYIVLKTNIIIDDDTVNFETELPGAIAGDATEQDRINIEQYYNERFEVMIGRNRCSTAIIELKTAQNNNKSYIKGTLDCPPIRQLGDINVNSTLFINRYPDFDHYITLTRDNQTKELVFSSPGPEQDTAAATSGTENQQPLGFWGVVKRFIILGIEHILLGFDHVLFLLATILIVWKCKDILLLITSFTIAHSITLILAGLDVITLTSRIVEPIIALSIIYMAARNIWILQKNSMLRIKERWPVTAGFGLVHGLGFAGALAEIEIPRQHFLPALITFNIGVEAGQLIILVVVLPWLILLKRSGWKWRHHLLSGVSLCIALIALFWFFERVR